jgi:hypothetical protein
VKGESPHSSSGNLAPKFDAPIELKDLELLEQLGKGSSGSVQKARHKSTGIMLAVKVSIDVVL